MSLNPGEQLAVELMGNLGLDWERIAETSEPRADFHATDGICHYVFEVKQREDDKGYESELREAGHAVLQQSMGRLNRISSLITHAASQLRATPAADEALRIIFFVAAGRDDEVQEEQFVSTLYGKVDLITGMKDGCAQATPCFYLSFNEFYRLPDVDASLTVLGDRCRLFINAFSQRLATLRTSRLYQTLHQSDAVVDPNQMEAAGEAFVADCSTDRRDREAMLTYVKVKYNLPRAIIFEPTHVKAGVVVPRP